MMGWRFSTVTVPPSIIYFWKKKQEQTLCEDLRYGYECENNVHGGKIWNGKEKSDRERKNLQKYRN